MLFLGVCSSGSHLLTAVDGGSVSGSRTPQTYREASNELRSWRGWSQLIISCCRLAQVSAAATNISIFIDIQIAPAVPSEEHIHGARHSLILLPTPFHWGSVGAPATSAQTRVTLRSGSHWNRP